jgi:hypothetical protein
MLRIEGGRDRRMIGVRVIVPEHLLAIVPELGFNPPQVVRRYQIPVRIVGATVRQRHDPKHFLHPTNVPGQNAAALGRVCSLALTPDLTDQYRTQMNGHSPRQRCGSLK